MATTTGALRAPFDFFHSSRLNLVAMVLIALAAYACDHCFAQFRFSCVGERLVQHWRRWFRLPAPIFLTWAGYLDYLLTPKVGR
jgi:hypothetical protein